MTVFDLVRRVYLRATSRQCQEWSVGTATCAARCGMPLMLGKPHYAITRLAQRLAVNNDVEPCGEDYDGEGLAYVHLGCWPGEDVVIAATVNAPNESTVRSEVTP